MSTFAQLSALPGVGVAYLLDVSIDDFATTLYRWSTHHVLVGSNQYEGRIQSMGNLSRELAVNNSTTIASVNLSLDNTDGGADWLCDRSTFESQALAASFQLKMLVFNPLDVTDQQSLQLGVFSLFDNPTRTNEAVTVLLGDAMMARAGLLAKPPSVTDWTGNTDAARPADISNFVLDNPNFNRTDPAPLLFGTGPFPIQRICSSYFLVCAVAQDRASASAITATVYQRDGRRVQDTVFQAPTFTRSANFTINDRTYHLVYMRLLPATVFAGIANKDIPDFIDQQGPFYVTGSPFSQVSNLVGSGETALVHPATVVQDLLTSYAETPSLVSVDSTSFNLARTLRPSITVCGALQTTATNAAGEKMMAYVGQSMAALIGLATAGQFDLVFGKDGTVYAKLLAKDFSTVTTTPTTIDEPLMQDVTEKWPSKGERNAIAYRIWGKWNGKTFGPWGPSSGPNKTTERIIDVSWMAPDSPQPVQVIDASSGSYLDAKMPEAWQNVSGWLVSAFDSVIARPVLTFRTSLAMASLELGDQVTITWGRGQRGTPYNAARFRVEGWTLSPFDGNAIALKLLWIDEAAAGYNPFLLDDETLITRSTGSGGRTITVADSSQTVTFSSGSLIIDGVQPYDIIVIQDPAEASNAFTRNRALLILTVDDATHLTLSSSKNSLDFGGGAAGISAWTIYRGARTYHTAISDPTNYPSGGGMYGKISDHTANSYFSDGATLANTMTDG